MDINKKILSKLKKASEIISKKSRNSQANFIVASSYVVEIIEDLDIGMKNKNREESIDKIMGLDKKDKSQYLRDNGWIDYYHENNWINRKWFHDPSIKIDWVGMTLDEAYERVYNENNK